MTQAKAAADLPGQASEEDVLRAQQYGLLSRLLASAPDQGLLAALGQLQGDDSELGRAYGALADAARKADAETVAQEYFALFVGVGRGELLPYASFYLTGFLNERPLADLRGDLGALGLTRSADRFEPEDHIATLFEVMEGLALRQIDGAALGCGAQAEAGFFARHVAPWATMFFDDLGRAPSADFYRHVAAIGRAFMAIETRAFSLAR
ncbi:MAG: molecular chaperone TorD family protein [Paracoccus sp. (in: a-proteobacteria)]|nr:molecular chaperone TorD family protein [Paracoccus sp. (in: a-proteobacteria)]